MRFTPEDLTILYAALMTVIEGDDTAWDDLSADEVDRAGTILERVESKLLRDEEDDYEDDDDDGSDDSDEDVC